jgi:hypothetical protein
MSLVRWMTATNARASALPLALLFLLAGWSQADGQGRTAAARLLATTLGALRTYPVFFHTQAVRVRGTVRVTGGQASLANGDHAVLLAGPEADGLAADETAVVEVTGVFADVGRLTEGDPRLAGVDVGRLSKERFQKPWPGVGELPLLVVASAAPAEPFPAPSLRALALAPERYLDTRVTVSGRFRGRNLYGDQPNAPGRSNWDFVLQAAEASVWVTGLRPRGQGFAFDGLSRVDTDRWLEVSGLVRRDRHLVMVEATSLRLIEPPPAAAPTEAVARVPVTGPRPVVVFSAPTPDETDVPPTTRVRIQFSRDLLPASTKDQVRVSYLGAESTERGEPQPPGIAFTSRYDEGTRMLELRFADPLERFRTVRVELLEGIQATDGVPLVPWRLTFSVGG